MSHNHGLSLLFSNTKYGSTITYPKLWQPDVFWNTKFFRFYKSIVHTVTYLGQETYTKNGIYRERGWRMYIYLTKSGAATHNQIYEYLCGETHPEQVSKEAK